VKLGKNRSGERYTNVFGSRARCGARLGVLSSVFEGYSTAAPTQENRGLLLSSVGDYGETGLILRPGEPNGLVVEGDAVRPTPQSRVVVYKCRRSVLQLA